MGTPTVFSLAGNLPPIQELPRQKYKAAYSTGALPLLNMTEWCLATFSSAAVEVSNHFGRHWKASDMMFKFTENSS